MTEITAPTIFLPGTLCDERIWMPVWRQLTLSQRSYVPLQWAESMEHMMALTQDRIDMFEEKVHLIGFSMGGYVAALAALDNIDRVASLTLIGYDPAGLSQQEVQQRQLLVKSIEGKKPVGMNTARLRQYLTADELNNNALLQPILDMEADLGNSVLKAHIQSTTPRKDLSQALQKIAVPVHFICAEQDKIADPLAIEKLAQPIKHASCTCLSDTAHMMLLSEPKKVALTLERIICHGTPIL
ncbi:alpha/beta hydrolase [Aliiglaciecola sp. LCG003]|uniref:alpha/beta fold hydrolase n=1 Tax=Aliiglaciecola sp. LCG003 TaxID=3053655 RepID=UPI00257438AF|nr:alpha/beta hydrolase [Aliiglaciecola sp. LCG003]WJG09735.1 alpha/beta hydrolase [Aliiglaciecola sp. LCG003]